MNTNTNHNDPAGPDDFISDNEDNNTIVKSCGEKITRHLVLKESASRDMKGFMMFNLLNKALVFKSFCSDDVRPLQVSFVQHGTFAKSPGSTGSAEDLYLFGLATLKRTYPTTYIYRETFREKLVDMFVKGDVDFKSQKKFSAGFHVVTKDRNKLTVLLDTKPLDKLADFPELEIEIDGNKCLFRVSEKPVCEEEAERFIQLTKIIRDIF